MRINNYNSKKFNIYSYKANSNEYNSYLSLKYAYDFCKKRLCMGVITLPLRKDLIAKKINKKFSGHTEYFQKIDKPLTYRVGLTLKTRVNFDT